MLSQAKCTAVLPAADMDRAQQWYQEKLGLTPTEQVADGIRYEIGGTRFLIYSTPNPQRGGHTQMGFEVADVRAEQAELRSRGVVFEEYDFPGLKTVDGLATVGNITGGWFKDSEGNILSVVQRD